MENCAIIVAIVIQQWTTKWRLAALVKVLIGQLYVINYYCINVMFVMLYKL